MAEETETVKFLEKECQVTHKKSTGLEKISMSNGDFSDVLASYGVTKEVRETIHKAHDSIVEKASTFVTDRMIAANKGKKEGEEGFVPRIELHLGSGNDAMCVGINAHKISEGTGISGQPYKKETWGKIDVKLSYSMAREVRKEGGLLDQCSDRIMKAMGGKKSAK